MAQQIIAMKVFSPRDTEIEISILQSDTNSLLKLRVLGHHCQDSSSRRLHCRNGRQRFQDHQKEAERAASSFVFKGSQPSSASATSTSTATTNVSSGCHFDNHHHHHHLGHNCYYKTPASFPASAGTRKKEQYARGGINCDKSRDDASPQVHVWKRTGEQQPHPRH